MFLLCIKIANFSKYHYLLFDRNIQMKYLLEKLIERKNLSYSEVLSAFDSIMSGEATPSQVAGFLIALRMKGETAEEIAGGAASMRRHAIFIDTGGHAVVDTCGTGGDKLGTFNISTASALIASGAGVTIAKHGNRSVSSKCGSADVLETLGVNINASPEVVSECIREAGIGFLFAPQLHPAMKHAMPTRRELGVRTIFNMLGPLTNPAGAQAQVIGVFDASLTETFASVLSQLGTRHAFIVHGKDGMDEITTTTTTRISELLNGKIRTYELNPLEFIETYSDIEQLKGGDRNYNADIIRRILKGEKSPQRDIVCLNAAAAIVVGGKAANLKEGWMMAQEAVDSGHAMKKLEFLISISNRK